MKVPEVYDRKDVTFVLLPVGIKFPPQQVGWQLPENGHTYQEACEHNGNVGVRADRYHGYIGLDEDVPEAFICGINNYNLAPTTTTWETRPGRLAMWYQCDDITEEVLARYGKASNLAQFKLYKDGQAVGELKLERSYQVIPNSQKWIDPVTGDETAPGTGQRVDYKLLNSMAPTKISGAQLLEEMRVIGITFKQTDEKADTATCPMPDTHVEPPVVPKVEGKARAYALGALESEYTKLSQARKGVRYDQAYASACALGELKAAGLLEEKLIIERLMIASALCGLSPKEAQKSIHNGLKKTADKPRKIPEPELPTASPEATLEEVKQTVVYNPILEVHLEPDNFISEYQAFAATTCDAYPEYHYGSALELAAVAADRNVVIEHKHGDIYTNIWIFGLGDSTVSRKSTAHKFCRLIAKSKYPMKCLPSSFSPESLMDGIAETPKCYYMKDEAGSLLASLCKDYMKETQDFLSEIYECDDYHRKLKKSECFIVDPYVNQYLMTTPDNLKEYTTPLNLTSGWLLRYMWFYPNHPKEWKPFAEKEEIDFERFAAITAAYNRLTERLTTRRRLRLSPESMAYFDIWHRDLEVTAMANASNVEKALAGRLATYAIKIAALFTICRADYTETSMIELPHIKEACRQIVEYFLPIGIIVVDEVARAESKNTQDKIMGTLKRNNNLIKHSILLRALHLPLKDVDAAVEALVQSEEIERLTIKDVVYYKKNKCNSEIVSHEVVYKGKDEELYKSQGMRDSLYTPGSATITHDHSEVKAKLPKVECKDANIPAKSPADPGKEKFMQGLKKHTSKQKRTCHICGYVSPHDLTRDDSRREYVGCYICTTCLISHRSKEKPAPVEASTQTSLA